VIFCIFGEKKNFKAHRYKIAKNLAIVKIIKIILKKRTTKLIVVAIRPTVIRPPLCDCATVRHQYASYNGRNEINFVI